MTAVTGVEPKSGADPATTTGETASAVRTLVMLRRIALTALFIGGIVAGIQLYLILNPPIDYGNLPPLTEAAEPLAADELTDLIVLGDEARLADRYPSQLLTDVATALSVGGGGSLQGLSEVRDIRYLGSVSDGADTLALYVAVGRLEDGTEISAGFSIRVRDGEVIGVN